MTSQTDLPEGRGRALLGTLRDGRVRVLLFSGGILAVMLIMALLAPVLWTVDPIQQAPVNRLKPPFSEWWFGTDAYGRDVYSRVVYGARVSLVVGFGVATTATLLGLLFGLLAGFVPLFEVVIMRLTDGLMSIPAILLAIALMALWNGSVLNVVIALTIAEFPRVTRLVRGVVLTLRGQVFVQASIAGGVRPSRILIRHILPNTLAPITVQATYIAASAMVSEAVLSFIGAGIPAGTPSWGSIIADGRLLWQIHPHLIFIPAAFLSITVLAVNLLGDTMRDMLDPRMAKRI